MNIAIRKLALLEKNLIEREEAARMEGYTTSPIDTAFREKVTQLKKDALKESGYNAFELNKEGVFGIFSIICLTLYSLILYIKQYEKKYFTPRYVSYMAVSLIILT